MRFTKNKRHVEVLEWITIVTDELNDGIISITVSNRFRFRFDKRELRRMEREFYNDL
jgi:hypothetical protein